MFVSTWLMVGGLEHKRIISWIRLMGEVVIPPLDDVRPSRRLDDRWTRPVIGIPALSAVRPSPQLAQDLDEATTGEDVELTEAAPT